MRKQPEIEGALKSFIRDELAKNPLASVETIRAELYRCGYYSIYRGQLDWHYISKLMRKVRVENIARLSTEDRRARWAAVRERHRILTEKMMSIVNAKMVRTVKGDGYPTVHDQIAAASVVMKWDVAMLWAETQLNLIEKPEAIEKKHTREVIVMDTVKIYELEMAALKEQSVGKPNAAYMIPEEKIKEVVDCMVRFGFLRKAK